MDRVIRATCGEALPDRSSTVRFAIATSRCCFVLVAHIWFCGCAASALYHASQLVPGHRLSIPDPTTLRGTETPCVRSLGRHIYVVTGQPQPVPPAVAPAFLADLAQAFSAVNKARRVPGMRSHVMWSAGARALLYPVLQGELAPCWKPTPEPLLPCQNTCIVRPTREVSMTLTGL